MIFFVLYVQSKSIHRYKTMLAFARYIKEPKVIILFQLLLNIKATLEFNIVNQEFHTEKPNMVWVSDVTEFYFDGKKFYLCAILDLFSRKVIAYKIARNNSTHLVKMTAKKAFETRKPEKGLIFHSDNGSNYISKVFCKYLDSFGVERSYSKTQTPHDNAVMESFFSSLKREELYRREIKSEREFEKTVSDYIEFYNKKRPHKTIGQKAPDVFEEKYFESLDNAG